MWWCKNRDSSTENHRLQDVVRGATNQLYPNATSSQDTGVAQDLLSFDSDGFSIGTDNGCNETDNGIVAWLWKAGGAPTADNSAGAGATPTAGSVKIDGSNLGSALAGSIAATRLSANTETGFSVVTYSGVDTPSTNTVAHGLSEPPELWVWKNLTTGGGTGWIANTTAIDGTVDYLVLNNDDAKADHVSPWSTVPTASVFTLGANNNDGCKDGQDYVAYCFHSIEGYSKVGIYIPASSSTDSTFVYTGFKPAYILSKSSTNASSWYIFDAARNTYNVVGNYLESNTAASEGTLTAGFDFCSNGFKDRGFWGSSFSGETILYYVIAESPFKYSNAR